MLEGLGVDLTRDDNVMFRCDNRCRPCGVRGWRVGLVVASPGFLVGEGQK